MRLGVNIGHACERLHNTMMLGLHINVLQMDEIWAFVGKKQRNVTLDEMPTQGDSYTWLALDANRKAIVSYLVGKRSRKNAHTLLADLRARIVNRPQITSDGYAPYPDAIEAAFGADVDYGVLRKIYSSTEGKTAERRYSPGKIRGIRKEVVCGEPDEALISTSYVERANLTLRMRQRRFTRLTNAFSKRLENHKAAVSLYVGFYNFCRVHETLGGVTPAMELGVTDHIWSIGELIEVAMGTPNTPPPSMPYNPDPGIRPDRKPFKLYVVAGGRYKKKN